MHSPLGMWAMAPQNRAWIDQHIASLTLPVISWRESSLAWKELCVHVVMFKTVVVLLLPGVRLHTFLYVLHLFICWSQWNLPCCQRVKRHRPASQKSKGWERVSSRATVKTCLGNTGRFSFWRATTAQAHRLFSLSSTKLGAGTNLFDWLKSRIAEFM